MCQMTKARILEINGKTAVALFDGRKIELNVEFVHDLQEGDDVFFAADVAVEKAGE